MPDLKLPPLPDRTPVRIAISVSPELAADLAAYARLYREAYGREVPLAELIPAMLAAFLESDRVFARERRGRRRPEGTSVGPGAPEASRGGAPERTPIRNARRYT